MTRPLTRLLHAFFFSLTALLASCYSTAALHTARPIAPGARQTAVALGAFVAEEDGEVTVLPVLEAQFRFGLDERYDAGVHITNFGNIGFDLNYAVLLGESYAVSLDPSIEITFGTYAWLPILWDFYHTESLTLTTSIRGGRFWVGSRGDSDDFFLDGIDRGAWLYGGGLAAQIRLSESITLAPELRAIWVDGDGIEVTEPLISFSLGLIL